MFFEMDKQLLEMDQLRQILDDEMFDAFDGDHLDVLNAKVKFDVLAASRMVAKQRMAQSLPMMAQTFLTDPMHQMLQAQNKKIDVNELANMWFDISGWKNKASLIVDMTPEEKQQAAMNNPAAQKMQSEQQMLAAKTNAQLQIQDSDNAARAYREVQRQIIQQELKNMAVTGEPNPQMLGGE
jgi:protein required for attachment to host cells